MSLSVDSIFNGSSCSSCITQNYQSKNGDAPEFQIENKNTENNNKSENVQTSEDNKQETKAHKKKMQITSEIEGQYYCTYLVDEEGQKTKISQVPLSQVGIQGDLGSSIQSAKTSSLDSNQVKDAYISFELKQQLNLENNHRQNVRDMMDLINGKNNSNDLLGTIKSLRHLVM